MQPRVAFAVLLGVGALLHLGLAGGTVPPPRALVAFLAWVGLAAIVAAYFAVRAPGSGFDAPARTGPGPGPARRVDGLWLLVVPAAFGLFIHATSVLSSVFELRFKRAMGLCFFVFAVCAVAALRTRFSASEPPVPDGSPLARALGGAQLGFGLLLAAIGAAMVYRGLTFPGSDDPLGRAATLVMLAGGLILALIGIAVFALRWRDGV